MFQKMLCIHENGVCNLFFTLLTKSVNVINGCERLHKSNRSFSFLIVYVKATKIEIMYFWLTFDLTSLYSRGELNYVNLVG